MTAQPKHLPSLDNVAGALRSRLDATFDTIQILSPNRFRIVGGPTIEGNADPGSGHDPHPLIDVLWPNLYHYFYSHTSTVGLAPPRQPEQLDRVFLAELSAANRTMDRWDPFWRVQDVGNNGSVWVEKRNVIRSVLPGHYAFLTAPGRMPRVGESVSILAVRESLELEAGFHFTFGSAIASAREEADLLRFYFHIRAKGVPWLLSVLSAELNRYDIPFAFKCLTDPSGYHRTDAAVLYCAKRYAKVVLGLLGGLQGDLAPHLQPGTPLFTKELWPGVAVADDPGSGESFGQSRCVLLAQGILDAWLKGSYSREERMRCVESRFARAGLSLAKPFLRPGALDLFDTHESQVSEETAGTIWATGRASASSPRQPDGSVAQSNSMEFLEAADRIGCRLCRDAIWSGTRCNWMIWSPEPLEGRNEVVFRAAPPALFNGVAGIALFLAQLGKYTGDRVHRATVQGAVQQLRKAIQGGWNELPGYFLGPVGVGRALIEIGALCEDEAIVDDGIQCIERTGSADVALTTWDVLGGYAGTIPVLIDVAKHLGRTRLLEVAWRQGEALLAAAVAGEGGLSWPSPLNRTKNLVGFAQGTAGIACALAELYHESQDRRFLIAAREAVRYERQAFVKEFGGWPDYRQQGGLATNPLSYPVDWCRGAAGIGLSRLRLLELWGEDAELLEELEAARQAVYRALANALTEYAADFSLCQGLSGMADCLLQYLDRQDDAEARALLERVGRLRIDAIDQPGLPWPCGLPAGVESHDLMLGTAGIGYFFLRLYDPARVPSILIVRPHSDS